MCRGASWWLVHHSSPLLRFVWFREIMRALHPLVFKSTPEEKAEDDALFQRCAQLQFLSAENLDVPAGCNNEVRARSCGTARGVCCTLPGVDAFTCCVVLCRW